MRIPAAILAAILLLSACSGKATPVTPPSPPSGPSIDVQRLDAQAAIVLGAGIEGATAANIFLADVQALWDGAGWISYPNCKDGIITIVKPIDPEQFDVTIDAFYDTKCTQKFVQASLQATLFPTGNLSFTGTSATFDRSGKPKLFGSFKNTSTLTSTTVSSLTTGTITATPTGPALATFGLTCDFGTTSSCGFGGVAASAGTNQSIGVAADIAGFAPSGKSTGTTLLNGFTGARGSLHLRQGNGTQWTIDGGTLALSTTGTFSETVNAQNFTIAGSLALTDRHNATGAAESFASATGIANGQVTQSGKTYATFSTDSTGSGTLQYSDGTIGNILFFIVTS